MDKEQAIKIVKQALDSAIKAGISPNLDTAAILAQAWQIVLNCINEKSL